jgi:DNA-binding PadR family transcriptional regulator
MFPPFHKRRGFGPPGGGDGCGPFGWGPPPFMRGRRNRLFDSGSLRLLVLGLIAEAPRHGYDIIKGLKERFQGAYAPSPGSIYPILATLEEAGLVASAEAGGKRLFSITSTGLDYLADHAAELARLNTRVDEAAQSLDVGDLGEVVAGFRHALFSRLRPGALTAEQRGRLKDILARTAKDLENL